VQKEEIIQLHSFLFQVRLHFEEIIGQSDMFSAYDSLHVSPHHVHKSKEKQETALIELCKCLSDLCEKRIIKNVSEQ
jgi:hypothetical protein